MQQVEIEAPECMTRVTIRTFKQEQAVRSWVYAARGRGGLIKIGFSKAPDRRMRTLRLEHPDTELIVYAPGGRVRERRLHDRLQAHRVDGEWFRPHPEVMDVVGVMAEKLWEMCALEGCYPYASFREVYCDE